MLIKKMINKKFYLLFISFVLFFFSSYGAIFTREDVKECVNSLKKCKIAQINEKKSNIEIYCKDNVCTSIEFEDFTAKFPNNETLYTRVCNKARIESVVDEKSEHYNYSTLCSPTACQADSECLTNKCFKGVCVDNDAANIEKCEFTHHYHFFTISHTNDFNCGKLIGYSCQSDSECVTDNCGDGVCEVAKDHDSTQEVLSYLFYGGVLVLLCITFTVVGCCYCCCFKKRK